MSKQQEIWKDNFLEFLGGNKNYRVVRIWNGEISIVKDEKKCKDFELLDDAIKYYESIKNDKKNGVELLTAIFKGIEIVKEHYSIVKHKEEKQLNLSL